MCYFLSWKYLSMYHLKSSAGKKKKLQNVPESFELTFELYWIYCAEMY